MPVMHWFVVVPTAAGTAPVELLCTVHPEPPSRPGCDVYEFGDDGEMARAQFTDHGGVFDDAAGEADVDADDALSSPCFTPPPDDLAEPVVDWHAEYRLLDEAGTPATSANGIPRQPVFTSPASRPMTLTEQQAAMRMQTADAHTPSGLLFGALPEGTDGADTRPRGRGRGDTRPSPSHHTHIYPAGSRPEALRMGGSVSAGPPFGHSGTLAHALRPDGTTGHAGDHVDADTCLSLSHHTHPIAAASRPEALRMGGSVPEEPPFGTVARAHALWLQWHRSTRRTPAHRADYLAVHPDAARGPTRVQRGVQSHSRGPARSSRADADAIRDGARCAHGDPTPRAGASPHRQLEHSQWHAGREGRAVLTRA